jgi:hypothetical protein
VTLWTPTATRAQLQLVDEFLRGVEVAFLAYAVCGAVTGLLLVVARWVVGGEATLPALVRSGLVNFGVAGFVVDLVWLIGAIFTGDQSTGTVWRLAAFGAACAAGVVIAVDYAPPRPEHPESAAVTARLVERWGPRPKVIGRCLECGRNEWPACRCKLAREGYPMTPEDPDEIRRAPAGPTPVWGTPPTPGQEK